MVPEEMGHHERWVHREAVVNGVRLHYVEAGAGPVLHGFHEFWYTWPVPACSVLRYSHSARRGDNRDVRSR